MNIIALLCGDSKESIFLPIAQPVGMKMDFFKTLEHQKIELEKARVRFAETLEGLEEELARGKTLQNTMVDRLISATFTTKNKS